MALSGLTKINTRTRVYTAVNSALAVIYVSLYLYFTITLHSQIKLISRAVRVFPPLTLHLHFLHLRNVPSLLLNLFVRHSVELVLV